MTYMCEPYSAWPSHSNSTNRTSLPLSADHSHPFARFHTYNCMHTGIPDIYSHTLRVTTYKNPQQKHTQGTAMPLTMLSVPRSTLVGTEAQKSSRRLLTIKTSVDPSLRPL
jgi:hypothetical protein